MSLITMLGGNDISSLVRRKSIKFNSTLNRRNTMGFRFAGTIENAPCSGDSISLTRGTVTVFSGSVDDYTQIDYGNKLLFTVECVDNNAICERFRVNESYTNKTAETIVKDFFNQFVPSGEGITFGSIEEGPTITGPLVFDYKTLTQALNRMSKITGFVWYIDYDKKFHFHSRATRTAPIALTDTTSYVYGPIRVQSNRDGYRNVQIIRAGYETSDAVTDTFKGDGEKQVFQVRRPIAETPTITVDGVSKTVGIHQVDTGKDFYWNKGADRIIQDSDATALISTETLSVTYKYLYPIRVKADKGAEISSRGTTENNSGEYWSVEDRPSIDAFDAALEEADGLLVNFGTIDKTVEFEVFEHGLEAGQLISITKTKHGLAGEFLISEVTSRVVGFKDGTEAILYTVKALSGTNVNTWIDFFRNVIEAGSTYVIRDNEVLVKLKSFQESLTITDSLTISKESPETRVGYALVGYSEVG